MVMTKKMIDLLCAMKRRAVLAQDVQMYREYIEWQKEIGRLPATYRVPRDAVLKRELRFHAIEEDYTPDELVEESMQWLIARGYEEEAKEALECRGE